MFHFPINKQQNYKETYFQKLPANTDEFLHNVAKITRNSVHIHQKLSQTHYKFMFLILLDQTAFVWHGVTLKDEMLKSETPNGNVCEVGNKAAVRSSHLQTSLYQAHRLCGDQSSQKNGQSISVPRFSGLDPGTVYLPTTVGANANNTILTLPPVSKQIHNESRLEPPRRVLECNASTVHVNSTVVCRMWVKVLPHVI